MLLPLVVAPVLARQWPSLRPDPDATGGSLLVQRMRALAGPAGHAALALSVAIAALYAAGLIKLGGVTPPSSTMPSAALDYARDAGLKGHVLNHYNYGGYLIRAGVPTFIDGRGELYGGAFIKRYAEVTNLRGEEFPGAGARTPCDRVDAVSQGPAGQQTARAAARLAAGLCRRLRHHLRAHPLGPFSFSARSRCSGRSRTEGPARYRAPCPNRACGPRRRCASRPRRSAPRLLADAAPWLSCGR